MHTLALAGVASQNQKGFVNAVELVNPESPAGLDGTIQPGDCLLSVGNRGVEATEVSYVLYVSHHQYRH